MYVNQHGLRIALQARRKLGITQILFSSDEGVTSHYRTAHELVHACNAAGVVPKPSLSVIYATGLLAAVYREIISVYLSDGPSDAFKEFRKKVSGRIPDVSKVLSTYAEHFPLGTDEVEKDDIRMADLFIHEIFQKNRAVISAVPMFFDSSPLKKHASYIPLVNHLFDYLASLPPVGSTGKSLPALLLEPIHAYPDDLVKQLEFVRIHWKEFIPDLLEDLLRVMDVIKEEKRPIFPPGSGPSMEPDYTGLDMELEQFSVDANWMSRVVMIAKSTLVWFDQLSKQYGYAITRLDQIPDQELDILAERGFSSLWLIGLWERSPASRTIKHRCGNPEAEASAYSLLRYEIADSLGGWEALHALKERCSMRGIRLACDMVPNHTGLDSDWMISEPDLFLHVPYPPFPAYTYTGEDLCGHSDVGVYLEDHYYDRTDAAVTCKRVHFSTGDTRYIYHGNDGTATPWNDTAQLDYLNPRTRELVIETIVHVARSFPVIRFDAAMTLAKRHIQRLWYPRPGHGGDIPGRAAFGMDAESFQKAMPQEFWREVVDRIAEQAPDTLLLAEAFWMMEGYFVRTLGMHRVYNSAFMNMLKNEENEKYRNTIKHTITFDPEILKRFVNFMNNPDEDTAIAQFGDGDKYFGAATLLATMPGLPMFGHGQVEGFHEKYGMEYSRSYWNEVPNQHLVHEHYRRIFPLLKLRPLFCSAELFRLYDFHTREGINQDVYVYTNGTGTQRGLIIYNNSYERTAGWFHTSAPYLDKSAEQSHTTQHIAEALGLSPGDHRYLIFHDPIGKLSYIRSSLEVWTNGLYADLNGYETQVYLDFREVADIGGLYHELAGLLQGTGSSNIGHELLLLRLRPIHRWILPFAQEDQLHIITSFCKGDETVLDMVKQRYLALYRGLIQSWNNEFHTEGTEFIDQMPEFALRVLLEMTDQLFNLFSRLSKISLLDTEGAAYPLSRFLIHAMKVMPEFPVGILTSLLICPMTRASRRVGVHPRYTKELLLDSIFDEMLTSLGVAPEEIPRFLLGSEILTRYDGWAIDVLSGNRTSQDQLAWFFSDPLFQEFTKSNWHNGIQWYHKESFQEALVWLAAAQLFSFEEESLNDQQRMHMEQRVHAMIHRWYLAETQSSYQVSKIIELA